MVELEFVLCQSYGVCLPVATFFGITYAVMMLTIGIGLEWLLYKAVDRLFGGLWFLITRLSEEGAKWKSSD